MADTIPFAERYRPQALDQVVGQDHLLGAFAPLRIWAETGSTSSAIFYGPPGTGKTTVARIIAEGQGRPVIKLNATSAGSKELKDAIDKAEKNPSGILLYLDEVQYLNKKQQQVLLPAMESGKIRLIGSTTENPYFYIYGALLSRSMVFEFKPVPGEAVMKNLIRICQEENVLCPVSTAAKLTDLSGGDVRRSLEILELAVALMRSVPGGRTCLKSSDIDAVGQAPLQRYDRGGDETYDLASALMKSLRGSDPDAALYYLARFLVAGDLLTPIRRILCSASEDIGLAWPQCASIVKDLCDTALQLGLPEAKLPLGQAVIMLANAPKSNSAHNAIIAAMTAVENGAVMPPPRCLQNKHCDTGDAAARNAASQGYLYPHDYPGHWVPQHYLPEGLDLRFYAPQNNPAEQNAVQYWESLKNNLGG